MNRIAKIASALTVFGMTLTPAQADEAIIIGGGHDLLSSQGQIELNVQFAKDTFTEKGISTTLFFTDGDDPANDVYIQHAEALDTTHEPISRVFGDYLEQNREYRSHALENVSGGTRLQDLQTPLRNILSSAVEPLWLIYNGHGKQSFSTPDQVTMELWGSTQLSADDLHHELKATTQPLRYVFTQCYSGGFHSIAYEKPTDSLLAAKPQRCGFTSVSAYSLAEGCSASVDTDNYQDYTTYFFAALSGYERDGSIILSDPDTGRLFRTLGTLVLKMGTGCSRHPIKRIR